MKKNKSYIFASLFGKSDGTDYESAEKMTAQIRKIGGMLHFTITREEDGWSAQCDEIQGIITGGANSDPTKKEIEHQIRDAIHVAFNVSSKIPSEKLIRQTERKENVAFALA